MHRNVTALLLLAALAGCTTTHRQPQDSPPAALVPNAKALEIPADDLYTYRAVIRSVYDGDTVTADVDLGFHVWVHGEKLRLYRIDAPEVRGPQRAEGLKARDWLRQQLLGKTVLIRTIKDKKGKYGRYLVEIHLDGVNINDELVRRGFAVYRDYD